MKRQWSEWIEHKQGEHCPIPEAKAGEYELRFEDGNEEFQDMLSAVVWSSGCDCWSGHNLPEFNITHYRYLLPEPTEPVKDWESVARLAMDLVSRATQELELLRRKDTGAVYDVMLRINMDAALSTYEDMKK